MSTKAADLQGFEALAERLLLDKDFRKLETILEPFNIFKALAIETQESAHSAMLAYLVNPEENHGLGDRFLRELILEFILEIKEKQNSLELRPIDVFGLQLDRVQVHREFRVSADEGSAGLIDLLVECPGAYREKGLLIIIENKVLASESSTQLANYASYGEEVREEYPHQLRLFLTPGAEATRREDSSFYPVSYRSVLKALKSVQSLYAHEQATEIASFISQYRKTLERYVMEKSEVSKLCEELWRNHRKALEQLMKFGDSTRGWILKKLENQLGNGYGEQWKLLQSTGSEIRFIPSQWEGMHRTSAPNPYLYFALIVQSDGDKGTLYLRLDFSSGGAGAQHLFECFQKHPKFRDGKAKSKGTWSSWRTEVFKDFKKQLDETEEVSLEFLQEKFAAALTTAASEVVSAVDEFSLVDEIA